jgi:hypothetical protein
MDEMLGAFGDITINAEADTAELNALLKEKIDKIIELLNKLLGASYQQASIGLHSYIPALQFDYELIHKFDTEVMLTGITYSQTGWKVTDCWSLYIGEKLVFDGIFTKEIGEYKHFNSFYSVSAGTAVKIIYHNKSGNSKQVWFDINYLKNKE